MIEKLERLVLIEEVKAFSQKLSTQNISFELPEDLESFSLTDLRWLKNQLHDLARTPQ